MGARQCLLETRQRRRRGQCELTGDFLVLDARSGEVLPWRELGGPAGGGVVTYSVHGIQNPFQASSWTSVDVRSSRGTPLHLDTVALAD